MKILKTLAVLFVLLALTVGAVAETYPEFTPYSKEELQKMKFILPVGMAEAVTQTEFFEGLAKIHVDSDKVKWDYIAAQSSEWNGAEIFIDTPFMSGANGYRAMIGGNSVGSANMSTNLSTALEDMWTFLNTDSVIPTGDKAGFRWEITSYSSETGTVTPIKYSGNRSLMIMNEHYYNGSLMDKGCKYALIEIVYTDNSSVKVEDIEVPSGRITLDANASEDSYKSSGVAAYRFEQINVSTLTTTIAVPEGAVSVTSEGNVLTIKDNKIAIPMTDIGTDDYYASKTVSLLWYKEDGTVFDAERIVISVEVGNPVVWPNYIKNDDFTKADTNAYFVKGGSKVSTGYMNAVYSANSGTVTVSANDSIASANEDMTEYSLRVEITPPTDAAYGTSYGVVSTNMLGKNPNGYTLSGIWNMYEGLMDEVKNAKPGDEAYVEILGGKAYFDDVLFKETSYKNDPGLKVYYDANQTNKSAATLQMIDWRNENGVAIGRQWVAVQYQPMAYSKPVDVVSAAPADAVTPVLVAETAVEGYTLRVQSYPQTSETETQIHYDLELLDENGENVSLSELNTDVQLLLPYQTEGGKEDNTVVYTVNHYNANGGLKESITEEGNVTLERVDGGVLMTIKSLSPFVLSWEEVECEHADSEKYTYKVKDNVFIVSCDCGENGTFTIDLVESYTAGEALDCSITTDNWFGPEPDAALVDEKGNELTEMPTVPGKYTLKFSIENAEKEFTFEVLPAPAMPATGDNSLPLATLMGMLALALTGAFMLRRKVNG